MLKNELIRTVKIKDVPMILDIYSYYVENTIITFEITPPDIDEMKRRVMETVKAFDWIIYELNGTTVGYAYYTKFRERKAYDYSCETTVYVHKDFVGKGIGSTLYGELINRLKKTSKAVAIGGISLPNEASVRLHEKMGFKNVGILKNIGRKFNKWISVGYWELELIKNDEYIPEAESRTEE
jgi:L-amino acid N-acyltransferase YncA